MPRNVRNFWLTIDVDGLKKTVGVGPQNGEGGFSMTIFQRDHGNVSRAMTVTGKRDGDRLVLSASLAVEPDATRLVMVTSR